MIDEGTPRLRVADSLEAELWLSARQGWSVVLVLPTPEFLGEEGDTISANPTGLRVRFDSERTQRMWRRLTEGCV
jgi:hypothetical protein